MGHEVEDTFEPTDGPIGSYIRNIIRGEQANPHPNALALLFAADRVDHLARQIEPALKAGRHVICDRYVGSSLAYQGSECDPDWVRRINQNASSPDLTLYLQVDAETALARIQGRDGERRDLYERLDKLERIAAGYDRVYPEELEATIVDASADPDTVFDVCREAVYQLMLAP